jgi:hypothetical protein
VIRLPPGTPPRTDAPPLYPLTAQVAAVSDTASAPLLSERRRWELPRHRQRASGKANVRIVVGGLLSTRRAADDASARRDTLSMLDPRGRVVVVVLHKPANTPRPPETTAV